MTCSRSSDVAPGASSSTGSMPTARSRRLEATSKSRMTGPATVRYTTVDHFEGPGERDRTGDGEVLSNELADDHLQDRREDEHQSHRDGEAHRVRKAGDPEQLRERLVR